jgi:hypothetical protein
MKWKKQEQDYVSQCGRFIIVRYIRRGGIEWGLKDKMVPIPHSTSGCVSRLAKAKEHAEWRLRNCPVPDTLPDLI